LVLLAPLDLGDCIPMQRDHSFVEWWRKVMKKVKKEYKKRSKFPNNFGRMDDMETKECLCVRGNGPFGRVNH